MRHLLILCLVFLLALSANVQAQNAVRDQIDRDRQGLSYDDPKSLVKAKEFVRLDSNYYAGWYLEGMCKQTRAEDYIGFRNAAKPLARAKQLIEQEYDKELRTRTDDYLTFFTAFKYQQDYCFISYYLQQCYQDIERPDLAIQVLRDVKARNMQMEIAVEPDNYIAWIYHRNRMFTSSKYAFLKNSVEDNNKMALKYLDSAEKKINRDYDLNSRVFYPSYIEGQRYSIYHYRAILYSYMMEVDSADHYYDLLRRSSIFSYNNFANWKYATGDLKTAEQYYEQEMQRRGDSEPRINEYYYMLPMIYTYKGDLTASDTFIKPLVDRYQSHPGFGWYSIAYARNLRYQGRLAESQKQLDVAAKFQEVHIGTTWGTEMYKLCVSVGNYLNKVQQRRQWLFEHDSWWYRIFHCGTYFSMYGEEYGLRLILAAQLSSNPERPEVIYAILSTENLMNFDEVISVIDGFSNEYFIDYYKNMLRHDKRPMMKKYFRYYIGRLELNEGESEEAIKDFKEVLDDETVDEEYDKMLLARTYEGLCLAYEDQGDDKNADKYREKFYHEYPELVPTSKVRMKFRLKVTGDDDDVTKNLISAMKGSSIEFVDEGNYPVVEIDFTKEDGKRFAKYSAEAGGDEMASGSYYFKDDDADAGKLLAYRLFKIEKKSLGEDVTIDQPPPKKADDKPATDSTTVSF